MNGTDAFIAKFNTNGVRQWATYYGGSAGEQAMSCFTDNSYGLYVSGVTESTSGIATTGADQTSIGGSQDMFLVKLFHHTRFLMLCVTGQQ